MKGIAKAAAIGVGGAVGAGFALRAGEMLTSSGWTDANGNLTLQTFVVAGMGSGVFGFAVGKALGVRF